MHCNKFMLAASALVTSVTGGSTLSPSRNACMKRITPSLFRYDPYSALVIPSEYASVPSPVKTTYPFGLTALSCSPPASPLTIQATGTFSANNIDTISHTPSPLLSQFQSKAVQFTPAPSVHGVRFAVIKFKQETTTFLAPFRIVVGETVVVEGDRGENVGVVHEITQVKPSFEVTSKILRKANEKDLAALQIQREKEQDVKKQVQTLATSLGLQATIEDVEYQFDMNKLTIFVRRSAKNAFVDFRKLQRGLFREFRCRIWCSYMDEVEAVEQGPRSR